jgi:hypothetical protein
MDISEQDRETGEEYPSAAGRFTRPMVIVLGAVGVILALIAVDIVLVNGIQPAEAHPVTQVVKISGAPAIQPIVYLTVSPGIKPGADGKLHDAFSVTNFYVHAGQPIKLVIDNTDTAAHSIVAPGTGVSIMVKPGTRTYTLLVRKAGRFQWFCGMPCDPYSMAHDGYMRGFITAS